MHPAVTRLATLGTLPAETNASPSALREREELVAQVKPPITNDEARMLVRLLGDAEDSCFGLKWTMLHLIESTPGWPLRDALDGDKPWQRLLADRASIG
jgi:hypothetical protein